MKFVKKPLSAVLALLMVLTTISVFASTFDDGYMRTIEYQVRYFDELGYETTKVYAGEAIEARIYMRSDFIAAAHALYFLYDKSVLEPDANFSIDPDEVPSHRGGDVEFDDVAFDNSLINANLLPADTLDTYGSMYIEGSEGLADYFTYENATYSIPFTVRDDAPVGSIAHIFMPTKTIITGNTGAIQFARVTEAAEVGLDYTDTNGENSRIWTVPASIETVFGDEAAAVAESQGEDVTDIDGYTDFTFDGDDFTTTYVTTATPVYIDYYSPAGIYDVDVPGSETVWHVAEESKRSNRYYYDQTATASVTSFIGAVPHAPTPLKGELQDIPEGYYFAGWTVLEGDPYNPGVPTTGPELAELQKYMSAPPAQTATVEGVAWDYVDGQRTPQQPTERTGSRIADTASAVMLPITEGNYGDALLYDSGDESYLLELVPLILPKHYEITFDVDGNTTQFDSILANILIDEDDGTEYVDPVADPGYAPTKENAGFLGWATKNAQNELVDVTWPYTPTDDVTMYAKWSGTVNVTFNPNGGTLNDTTDPTVVSGLPGSTINTEPTPTKEGFRFAGWKINNAGDRVTFPYTIPAADVSMTAQWIDLYTVTFDLNGATGTAPADQQGIVGEKAVKPADPTWDGYRFDGWYIDANGNNVCDDGEKVVWDENNQYTIAANDATNKVITMEAQWTPVYTFTFDSAGGSAVDPATYTLAAGEKVQKPDDPTWLGRMFMGWQINGTDVTWTPNADDETVLEYTMPAENVTATAQWESATIRVDYYADGYLVKTEQHDYVDMATGEVLPYELPAFDDPDDDLNAVESWTHDTTGTSYAVGNNYSFSEADLAAKKVIFNAVLKDSGTKYKAEFKPNGGVLPEGFVAVQEYLPGETINVPGNPTREGYTFQGWDSEPGTMGIGDITFTAIWELKELNINFDPNYDGATVIVTEGQTYGDEVEAPEDPVRDGYVFAGWATTADAGVADIVDMDAETVLDPPAASAPQTYYAVWSATVTWNFNGGNVVKTTENVDIGTLAESIIPADIEFDDDMEYIEWFTDSDYTVVLDDTTAVTGNVTYYGRGTYLLTWDFNDNDITPDEDQPVPYGETITPLDYTGFVVPDTIPEGRYFVGWTTGLITNMVDEPHTITGEWGDEEYTFKFRFEGDPDTVAAPDKENVKYTDALEIAAPTIPAEPGKHYADYWTGSDGQTYDIGTNDSLSDRGYTGYENGQVITLTIAILNDEYTVTPKAILLGNDLEIANGTVVEDPNLLPQVLDGALYGDLFEDWTPEDVDEAELGNYEPYEAARPWYINENGTWQVIGDDYEIQGDIEVYQLFVPVYTITFNENGGESIADYENVRPDAPQNEPAVPVYEGYRFMGWKIGDTNVEWPYTATADVTMVAQWSKEYTVKFDNGEAPDTTAVPADIENKIAGETVSKPADDPVWDGYRFMGWDIGTTVVWSDEIADDYTVKAEDADDNSVITMTAQWSKEYTITFDKGEGAPASTTVPAPISNKIAGETVSKPADDDPVWDDGHPFLGWYIGDTLVWDDTHTDDYTVAATDASGDTITMVAKWQTNQYTITWNVNGADLADKTTADYSTVINDVLPADADAAPGAVSVEWFTDSTYETPLTAEVLLTNNVTIYGRGKYVLTWDYNNNGNPANIPETLAFGADIVEKAAPAQSDWPAGKTWGGWTNVPDSNKMPAAATTILGTWDDIIYTVTFDTDGAQSATPDDEHGAAGTTVAKPADPTKAGWKFKAWQINGADVTWTPNADDNTKFEYTIAVADADATNTITIKAVYEKLYTVTFDNGEAPDTVAVHDPITNISGTVIDKPADPVWEGYNFLYWAIDGTEVQWDNDKYTITGDVTMVAVWNQEYTVTFDNGEAPDDVAVHAPITDVAGTIIDKPADPVWDGYRFMGWKIGDTDVDWGDNDKYTISGNVTMVAQWSKLYTVTFDTVGGTPVPANAENKIAGETVDKPADPAKDGWRFISWQIGDTVVWDETHADAYTIDAEDADANSVITIKAVYAKEYTVTFDKGEAPNGTTVPENITEKIAGETVSKPTVDPVWDGYRFMGWNIGNTVVWDKDTATDYTVKAEDADDNSVITMTAQWSKEYTITFVKGDAPDGTTVPAPISNKIVGEPVSKPADDPTWTGHTFLGWNIGDAVLWDENHTNDYIVHAEDAVGDTITMVAQWKINEYKITWNVNGADLADKTTANYGTVINTQLPADADAAPGAVSVEWFTDANYQIPLTADVTLTDDVTIYGRGNYELTWNYRDDDVNPKTETETLAYGADITEKEAPAQRDWPAGKEWAGWTGVLAKMPAGPLTIYGTWDDITYTITFDTDGASSATPGNAYGIAGAPVGKPADPTKDGWRFKAWQIKGTDVVWDENDQYIIAVADADATNTITIKAVYDKLYTVTFDTDGALITPVDKQGIAGEKVSKPADPTKDGWRFKAWQINGTDVSWAFNDSVFEYTIDADDADENSKITIKAVYDKLYTVTFDTDGGTPIPENAEGIAGEKVTKPATDPVRGVDTFLYWAINGAEVVWDDNNEYTITGDVTITAVYNTGYTVTFDNGVAPDDVAVHEPINGVAGTLIDKPDDPVWAGYRFMGWQINGADVAWDNNDQYTIGGNVTMVAQWSEIFTVTFDKGRAPDGTTVPESITNKIAGETVSKPDDPTWDDYHEFDGWKVNGTGDIVTWPYTIAADDAAGGTITMVAQWADLYTVHFDANYTGAPAIDPMDPAREGADIEWPADPVRPGYNFLGWATTANAENPMSQDDMDAAKVVAVGATDDPQTYYAVWDTVTINIYYFFNEDRVMIDSVPYSDGSVEVKSYDDPDDEFDAVTEWRYNSAADDAPTVAAGSTYVFTEADATTGLIKFYNSPVATLQVKVTFNLDGGELDERDAGFVMETNGDAGRAIDYPVYDPIKEGYVFLGWDCNDTNAGNTDLTITALWAERDDITVYFKANLEGVADSQIDNQVTGDSVQFPEDLSKESYRFLGWAKSADATAADVLTDAQMDAETVLGIANQTYYGVWEELYTVTWNFNGADVTTTTDVESGTHAADIIPDDSAFDDDAYTIEWFTDDAYTTKIDNNTLVEDNVTYYGRGVYKLTWNNIDDNGAFEERYVPYKEAITPRVINPDDMPEGRYFVEWTDLIAEMDDEPHTITAEWADETYTFKFRFEGDPDTPAAPDKENVKYTDALAIAAPTAQPEAGKEYETYWTGSDGQTYDIGTNDSLSDRGYTGYENGQVITLTIAIKDTDYSITYKLLKLGNDVDVTTGTVEDNAALSANDVDDAHYGDLYDNWAFPETVDVAGYQFYGWYYQNGDSRDVLDEDVEITGNMTAYQVVIPEYTVTFDNGEAPDDVAVYGPITDIVGAVFDKPDDPEWAGHRFIGWKIGDTDVEWDANDQYTITGNVTMTAQWSKEYTVKFDNGEAPDTTTVPAPISNKIAGETVSKPADDPVWDGYRFMGWNIGATVVWDDTNTADYTVDADDADANSVITMTAQWAKEYTVTFDTDGGTPVPADAEDLIAGEKVAMPADPTKEGYRFVKWQINGTDVAWDTDDQYTVVAADADANSVIEMVAQWSRIYTVVFDLDKATDSDHTPPADVTVPESKTGEAGAKVPKPADPDWDEGHHFDGWQINGTDVSWALNDSGLEYEIDANDADANGVITMVAQWTTEKYSVIFDTNGADTPTPFIDPVWHGEQIIKPADPEKHDYHFNGWFIDENGNNVCDDGEKVVWDSDNKYTVTEAVTMVADWTDQFVVTFYTLKADGSGYEDAGTALVSTEGYINQADVPVEGTDFDHVQGYSFENEWYLNPECTGTPVDLNDQFTSNTDVYAKYVVIKLVPIDTDSTAMIERTTTAGTPLVETYTNTQFGRRGPAVTATVTAEYGDYTKDDCSKFFVYGLAENMNETALRTAVKAQGAQGDIRVTPSDAQDGLIGTGTVIEVIDTVVNEPVETFHVVIFGDVTGDAIVDNTDYASLGNQVTGSGTALSWDPVDEPWTQRAANINGDSVVNNADYSRLNYYFSNIDGYEINQIKGLVNTKPQP